jgi:hypothetical protein
LGAYGAMNVVWLEPWAPIEQPEAREAMQAELQRELCTSHPLFGLSVVALAKRYDQDDVLFGLADGRVAEVHLTWSLRLERDPRWPSTAIFASVAMWAEDQMRPLHEERVERGQ